MFKDLQYFLTITVVLSVVGCATYNQARKELIENLPESERSYLAGKFSVQCNPNSENTICSQGWFNSISVHYKSRGEIPFKDRLNSTYGAMFGDDTSYDVIDFEEEEKSFYFCRILPAGAFSLFNISYWHFPGGGSGYDLSEEDQFDIPFSLEEGKISIIDHLKLTTGKTKNLLGMSIPYLGKLEISRLAEDQVQLAIDKCPEIARNSEVLPQRLWRNEYGSPFVETKN